MEWFEILIKTVLFVIAVFCFRALISSAVESGNKELVYAIRESTSKICEELRKVRESNEKS